VNDERWTIGHPDRLVVRAGRGAHPGDRIRAIAGLADHLDLRDGGPVALGVERDPAAVFPDLAIEIPGLLQPQERSLDGRHARAELVGELSVRGRADAPESGVVGEQAPEADIGILDSPPVGPHRVGDHPE